MRYINLDTLELSEGWEARAIGLHARLTAAATATERKEILERNQIWQELIPQLRRLFNNKCWYSESAEVMSDMNVDHFRPKNEARNTDADIRDGYWWLAYNWNNYRLSSVYCNQRRKDKLSTDNLTKGKGSYFPLRPGSNPATRVEELVDEVFYLLDPTNVNDPELLSFDATGEAVPFVSAEENQWDYDRAERSIELFHLNHTPLREKRLELWNLIQRKINQLRNLSRNAFRTATDNATIEAIRQELREYCNKNSEYSAMAIACIEKNQLRLREVA
jgi:uncharacterized protein (TIGR02646 family)